MNIARPDTILVSEEFAETLADSDGVSLHTTPRVKLKGIGRTRPLVLRRQSIPS